MNYKILNKSGEIQQLDLKLLEPQGEIEFAGTPNMSLEVGTLVRGSFFVKLNPATLTTSQTKIKIGVFANGELIETISTNFNGPRVRTK